MDGSRIGKYQISPSTWNHSPIVYYGIGSAGEQYDMVNIVGMSLLGHMISSLVVSRPHRTFRVEKSKTRGLSGMNKGQDRGTRRFRVGSNIFTGHHDVIIRQI